MIYPRTWSFKTMKVPSDIKDDRFAVIDHISLETCCGMKNNFFEERKSLVVFKSSGRECVQSSSEYCPR